MEASTSVLIVAGSLNGRTMAMLLARRRVPCLVLERHSRTSIQYRSRGISPRSMEIFGYRDPAGAFADDCRNGSDDLFEDPRNPSGRPGSGAPHLLVTHGGGSQHRRTRPIRSRPCCGATDFVALQLEYPTESHRAVREPAIGFSQTAMTRSLQ